MKNLKLCAVALVVMMALPIITSAQNEGQTNAGQAKTKPCKQMCGQRGPSADLMELNLTDEQKQKIDQMHLEHQKKVLSLQNQLGEKRAHLKTLTSADAPDAKAINALIDEIGGLNTQLMKARVNLQLQIRSLLTEEQRLHFDMDKPGCGMRGESRGKGMGHGRGERMGQGMGMAPDMDPGEDFDEDSM